MIGRYKRRYALYGNFTFGNNRFGGWVFLWRCSVAFVFKKLLDKNAQAFGDMFDVNIREVRRVQRKFGGFGVTVVEYEMEDRNNEG